jgi:hypothetical protein
LGFTYLAVPAMLYQGPWTFALTLIMIIWFWRVQALLVQLVCAQVAVSDCYWGEFHLGKCLHRAFRHFGSVCIGAALTTMTWLLRLLADMKISRSNDSDDGIVAAILIAVVGAIIRVTLYFVHELMKKFSRYSLVYGTLTGQSFFDSAQHVSSESRFPRLLGMEGLMDLHFDSILLQQNAAISLVVSGAVYFLASPSAAASSVAAMTFVTMMALNQNAYSSLRYGQKTALMCCLTEARESLKDAKMGSALLEEYVLPPIVEGGGAVVPEG